MELKKKINELIALYEYEPTLIDIYVEGVFDLNFYSWFISKLGKSNAKIYCIEDIEISDKTLDEYKLTNGNRSKILALSQKLADGLSGNKRVLCIADKDNEEYVSSSINNDYLCFTDYNSLELYLWNLESIRKFFLLVLGGSPIPIESIMSQVSQILEDLFLYRLANLSLGWGMEWINFTKCVSTEGSIRLENEKFEKRYLQKNNKCNQKLIFQKEVEKHRKNLSEDYRLKIRGHDATALLMNIANKLKTKHKFCKLNTFEGAFIACIEFNDIKSEPLFKKIKDFLC